MIILLNQYKKARKELRGMLEMIGTTKRDLEDKRLINSMINSTTSIIEWIETGKNPYYEQGVDKRQAYHIQYLSNMEVLPDITDQISEEREQLELDREQLKTIKNVFKALSERERDCFILHVTQGMSMSEIADQLGINKPSVQTYINRARQKIKKLV